MNKFVKYAAIGLAGYFIGYYEFKYKLAKAIALNSLKKDEEVKQEEEDEVQQ